MKMQRRTGVNGVKENRTVCMIKKGGTAEYFGPLWGWKSSAFFIQQNIRKGEQRYET